MGDILDPITIDVPAAFQPFADAALLRLQVQYPDLLFRAVAGGIEVRSVTASRLGELRKQVSYAVYREKIYTETLPLRQNLVRAVTAR